MNFETDEALPPGDGDSREEIARLETRLEALAESLARCRKFRLASQAAIGAGGLWLVAALLGVVSFDPVALLLALAGVIGGTVMYGSNGTTTEQVETEMKEIETRRATLIGTLRLRVVSSRTLH